MTLKTDIIKFLQIYKINFFLLWVCSSVSDIYHILGNLLKKIRIVLYWPDCVLYLNEGFYFNNGGDEQRDMNFKLDLQSSSSYNNC